MSLRITKSLLALALRDLRGSRAMRSLWLFCASLVLGIALVSVCGNLLQLVKRGFYEQQRHLFGGDLKISQRSPMTPQQWQWVSENSETSLLLELRTMLGTQAGDFSVVELQSVDTAYPLYGAVLFSDGQTLETAVGKSEDGVWGAAFDPILTEQLGLAVGQTVSLGSLEVELRAQILRQPDRSLRADVRGPPVVIDEGAMTDSGLLHPSSLVDYEYRVRTSEDPHEWRSRLRDRFPDATWEVQTIDERGDLVSERLDQVASVLLLIGFSTLFIGGLGVSNSIRAWLQTKFATLATMQALGFRDSQVSLVFVGQVGLLGLLASTVGAAAGAVVAWLVAKTLSSQLPIDTGVTALLIPTVLAIAFGTLTALLFALPLLGRTLTLPTGLLIRGFVPQRNSVPVAYRLATCAVFIALVVLLLVLIPEPLVALAFVVVFVALLLVLELMVRGLQLAARWLATKRFLDGHISLRLAAASLSRTDSSLRPMLLSLGTALTLLVAATLVIAATVNTLNSTVPARAPSLVFYDLQQAQVDDFTELTQSLDGYQEIAVAPLVLGRLSTVNGEALSESDIAQRSLEANDEHKLSYRRAEIDNTKVDRGAWWPQDYGGPPLVAMEDREADQLGLTVGDELVFTIQDQSVPAKLVAIYSQGQFETSFWLEAVFSTGALEPFIERSIGTIKLASGNEVAAMSALAEQFPNVVMVRTTKVLAAARSVLAGASVAILVIAAISLAASVLVMASVVAVSRQRQVYEASVMHAIGSRRSLILRSVVDEYVLLATTLTLFATIVGSLIAWGMLNYWLKLPMASVWALGPLVAAITSCLCLLSGAVWLLKTLSVEPSMLLKRSGY